MTYLDLGILMLLVSFIKWLAGWLLFIGFLLLLVIASVTAGAIRKIKNKFSSSNDIGKTTMPGVEAEPPGEPIDYDKQYGDESEEP